MAPRPHRYSLAALDAGTRYGETYLFRHGRGHAALVGDYSISPHYYHAIDPDHHDAPTATLRARLHLRTTWINILRHAESPAYLDSLPTIVSISILGTPLTPRWGSGDTTGRSLLVTMRDISFAEARTCALATIAREIYTLRAWHTMSRRMARTTPGGREAFRFFAARDTAREIAMALK